MAQLALVKTPGGLRPADDTTAKVVQGLGLGEVVYVQHRQPRNYKLHNKWWALVRMVHDSTGKFASAEVLNDLVCIAIGHCDTHLMGNGQLYYKPRSISFAGMDEAEFRKFYERGMDELFAIAGGIDSSALREAVLQELSR